MARGPKITRFGFRPGDKIGGKYRVEAFVGRGVQGEVYRVTEIQTRVRRAAKLFYPQENVRNGAARVYARKLERLADCGIVIKYHHAETLELKGAKVTCLISEFAEGQLLSTVVQAQPSRRMRPFKALHVIHPLVCGLEEIHQRGEYHGDIHPWNILVRSRGIFFDVKLIDFYNHGPPSAEHRRQDIVDVATLLYDMLGGRARYARQPQPVKDICKGLRRDLIREVFPTATHLRRHLERDPDLGLL